MKICIKNPFSFTIFGGFLKKASLIGGAFVLKKPDAGGNFTPGPAPNEPLALRMPFLDIPLKFRALTVPL